MNFTPAGRLRHEITIEQLTGEQQASNGETTPVWTAVETTFAEVKPLRGRNVEIASARTKGRTLTHQITLRYGDIDLDPVSTRIVFQGRRFEIFQAINVLEQGVEWDCLCNEIVA